MFQAVGCFGQLGISGSWVFRAVGYFGQLGVFGGFSCFCTLLPGKMSCKASTLPVIGRFLEYFDDLYPCLMSNRGTSFRKCLISAQKKLKRAGTSSFPALNGYKFAKSREKRPNRDQQASQPLKSRPTSFSRAPKIATS